MIVIKDVTKEYRQLAKPGYGEVTFSPNYEQRYHRDEIIAAEWLHQEFGGDLCLLTEVDRTKVKTPDYLWRGKKWERKGISSCKFNTINKRIREAYEQIRDNRGGILLDFTGCNLSMERITRYVIGCIQDRAHGTVDIIIKKKQDYIVLRAKKE